MSENFTLKFKLKWREIMFVETTKKKMAANFNFNNFEPKMLSKKLINF